MSACKGKRAECINIMKMLVQVFNPFSVNFLQLIVDSWLCVTKSCINLPNYVT